MARQHLPSPGLHSSQCPKEVLRALRYTPFVLCCAAISPCLQRKDWLALVAVHSDSWLLSLAFYKGARLNREQR